MQQKLSRAYYFYQQLGLDFIDENNQVRKNRSQNFSFGLIEQTCNYHQDAVTIRAGIYTPYGSREFSEVYPRGTVDEAYLHQHDFYELMYICSGIVNTRMETQLRTYQAGDAVLINRFTRHAELYDHNGQVLYLGISKSIAQDLLQDLRQHQIPKELDNFLYQNTEREDIYTRDYLEFRRSGDKYISQTEALLGQLKKEMAELQPGYLYVAKALLLRFFQIICDQTVYRLCVKNKEGNAQDQIFEAVRACIVANNGIVSRSDLEQHLHFHGDYLNKIVKARTGMSLLQFAQNYRLKEAARLLGTTNKPVSQISQILGFSNKTQFYRLFQKNYHMTPMDYRRFCNTRK